MRKLPCQANTKRQRNRGFSSSVQPVESTLKQRARAELATQSGPEWALASALQSPQHVAQSAQWRRRTRGWQSHIRDLAGRGVVRRLARLFRDGLNCPNSIGHECDSNTRAVQHPKWRSLASVQRCIGQSVRPASGGKRRSEGARNLSHLDVLDERNRTSGRPSQGPPGFGCRAAFALGVCSAERKSHDQPAIRRKRAPCRGHVSVVFRPRYWSAL
jgi:hypothetical protein